MKDKTLNDFKENIFSQYGEDGIIREILRRLNISSGVCVEFGAWDGVLLSNTANLWINGNWKGVLIEAGKERVETLKKVLNGYDCIPCNDFVTPRGETSTEGILKREKINFSDVKVLSVDIDGNEYHILDGLTTSRPVLIIAEYNPTIPPEMDIVSVEDAFFGSSAKALTRLMKSKGYSLVAMTNSNCFFIENTFIDAFSDLNISFDVLFDRTWLTYLITGQAGAYAFSQSPAYGMGLPLDKKLIQTGKLFFISHSHFRVKWIFFKDWVKNLIGVETVNSIKDFYHYVFWILKGKPVPAHTIYKRAVLKKYAKKYHIKTFVETGTAGGGTARAMASSFNKIYTIEHNPTLYHQGKALLYDIKKIKCLDGDVLTAVQKVLKEINEPTLFWIDSHYLYQDQGIYGPVDNSILEELKSIINHTNKSHVVVLDDKREFNGKTGYPELTEVKRIISENASWYTITEDNDLLIIQPLK